MEIVVCVKRVPTTDTAIKIAADGKSIDTQGVQFELNAYDEFALEQALRIKEQLNAGSVTVVTLGPKEAQKELRDALARGADNNQLPPRLAAMLGFACVTEVSKLTLANGAFTAERDIEGAREVVACK